MTEEIVHPALAPARFTRPLAVARLTDRQRLGLLLEGAALLSLLHRAGWWLPHDWEGAAVSETGRLRLPPAAARAGRPQRQPQELLRDLLAHLFGAGGDGNPAGAAGAAGDHRAGGAVSGAFLVAGRGQARRAARTLLAHWWQALVPLPADEAVGQIVAAAPFLWESAFAPARESLAGEVRHAGVATLWIAGSGAARARLLAGCSSLAEVTARLASAAARSWWEAAPTPAGSGAPTAVCGEPPHDVGGVAPAGADPAAGRKSGGADRLASVHDDAPRDAAAAAGVAGAADLSRGGAGKPVPAGRPARRWKAVAAAALRNPPATEAGRLEVGEALLGLGRFEGALAALAPCRSAAARVLRVRCQAQLGRLGAARVGLRRLEALPLVASEAIAAADVAVRVFANSGEPERLPRWVERALAAVAQAAAPARARAHLVAAMAAWDRQLPAEMEEHLEAARLALVAAGGLDGAAAEYGQADGADAGAAADACTVADVVWRWHHTRALCAIAAADGAAATEHVSQALRMARRSLARHQAAGLWNDLGIGRVQAGDLAGAERAFLHAQRLFTGCDGPRRTTLALHNLAEVRLRRGRVGGVREILERSAAENRSAGNLRGLSQDAELRARLELVLGRPEEAAAICQEAIARLDRRRFPWRRDVLETLAGRALGWLQRPAEAAAALARASPEALAELEPEERPAVWAHAGDRAAARRAAAAPSPAADLWQAVLAGKSPPPAAWQALAELEPYRAARLVFDLERFAGEARGLAPAEWRTPAVATLRRLGAGVMADWLEARDAGPWEALAAYAARPAGDLRAAAALLRHVGGPGVRLARVAAGEVRDADPDPCTPLLVAGLPGGDSRLELRGPVLTPPAAACFALAARDLAASPALVTGVVRRPDRAAATVSRLVGSSAVLRAATARLRRLAAAEIPVLILGESGTGKELAAREIHRFSARSGGPFLAINCAAVAESLLMSDLFGHVRGAFTGADRERTGVFETARGGIVLLDEIGDLPLAAQGLLLRVLQESEVRRLGESLPRSVDVRVLAATHRDLAKAVAAGTFREDLFYRLRVGAVELPPLRDRGDDVLELADYFLARRPPHPARRLSPAARERLRRYSWPGNVRELENVLRLAAALAHGGDGDEGDNGDDGGLIQPDHLELPAAPPAAAAASGFYHQQVESFRRRLVVDALAHAGGRHALAARRLGISRQAFSYLVRQLGLRS
jgi:DNA-binding NtrC family response regulator